MAQDLFFSLHMAYQLAQQRVLNNLSSPSLCDVSCCRQELLRGDFLSEALVEGAPRERAAGRAEGDAAAVKAASGRTGSPEAGWLFRGGFWCPHSLIAMA